MLMRLFACTMLLSLAAIAGCSREKPSAKEAIHDLKGQILSLDVANSKVELKHEKIGDWMEPMTMWFKVEERKMLEGLRDGDMVQGRVKVYDGGRNSVITELRKQ